MGKRVHIIIASVLLVGIGLGLSINVSAEEGLIPSWIKTTAGFWVDDQISDSEFIAALQFLVKGGILLIPEEEVVEQQVEQPKTETTSTSVFPDPHKDPWDYVERYNNEPEYRDWFNRNYPGKTVYEVVGLPEPEYPGEEFFVHSKLRASNPDWVGITTYGSEDEIQVYVSFNVGDPNLDNFVPVDGYGKLRIVNDNEETVYTGTFLMNEDGYLWYTHPFAQKEQLEFLHAIPISEIKKSDYSNGIAYLSVETRDTTFDEAFSQVFGLPTFGSEDFESVYLKSSTLVNKKISKGSFEVTVKSVGFFKQSGFFGEAEEYFRVDLTIKNISNEKKRAGLNDFVILDSKNQQFSDVYGGTIDSFDDLYPGVTRDGYELFEKIPDDTKRIRILFDLGRDSNYNSYSYEFIIDLN